MTNERLMGAGVAVLLTGAMLGWGASRMTPAQATPATPYASTVSTDAGPRGDLTPSVRYRTRSTVRSTVAGITVPAGTPMAIAVNTDLNTRSAEVGQTWHGEVMEDVYAGGRLAIPAGSPVSGTVRVARPAERGSRATLQLGLSSVSVRGRSYTVTGPSQSIVAGSPRTRNVASIAGGTAAGALIGRAVGHSTKSTVIGAVVGGGAATAAVAASKGYQAHVEAGQPLAFTTSRSVTVRRS